MHKESWSPKTQTAELASQTLSLLELSNKEYQLSYLICSKYRKNAWNMIKKQNFKNYIWIRILWNFWK